VPGQQAFPQGAPGGQQLQIDAAGLGPGLGLHQGLGVNGAVHPQIGPVGPGMMPPLLQPDIYMQAVGVPVAPAAGPPAAAAAQGHGLQGLPAGKWQFPGMPAGDQGHV